LIGPDALPCTRAAETGSLSDEVRCAAGHCSAPGGGCDVPPRLHRADGGGVPPPQRYALFTVTEVTELSFPPPGAAAVQVPRRTRADGGGIPPPPRYALCTVTELTEVTF
jgi:hypothetical protein